jgi:hypothetical protein
MRRYAYATGNKEYFVVIIEIIGLPVWAIDDD